MKLLRKITIFALIALLVSSFTGCGFILGDAEYYSAHWGSEKRGREKAEQLITYINNKDYAGIKSMFSPKNRRNNKDLNSKINELLAVFPDGLFEYEISPLVGGQCETESWSVKTNEESVDIAWFDISEVKDMISDEYVRRTFEDCLKYNGEVCFSSFNKVDNGYLFNEDKRV